MDLYYKNIDCKYSSIKEVLKSEFNISSRLYVKLKNSNHIYINSEAVSFNNTLNKNDIVEVDLSFIEDNSNIMPTQMDIKILYEDKYMLIIDKPAGYAIHPSILHYDTSISNGIKFYFDKINLKRKIRIVNRLDKDTSGIVIIAKNEYVQECLIYQMKNDIFKKEYIGILERHTRQKIWYNSCSNC